MTKSPSPKSREEALGTEFEKLWETPDHWPRNIRVLPLNDFGKLGLDPKTNELYWDGKALVTKNLINLGNKELKLAYFVAFITAVATVWPIGVAYGWWGTCDAWIPTNRTNCIAESASE